MEGRSFVEEALSSNFDIDDVFVSEAVAGDESITAACRVAGVEPVVVAGHVLRSISDAVTPQGIVAVVRMAEQLRSLPPGDLFLVLASIRDPGNAGTLIRSAVAAGAHAVLFAGESVDPFSPKCVRASAGNLFKVPIVMDASEGWVTRLAERDIRLVGSGAGGDVEMFDADLTRPTALVIGNEAWGLPDTISEQLDVMVRIPMPGPVESLNAGIAGSLLLFETVRQRRLGSSHHG